MSNTAPKFVSASCACGASFDREVKRGRPQIWCPTCVAVPFYDRIKGAAPTTVTATGEVVVVVKPVNENDPLSHVREQIEMEIAAINLDHKVRYALLVSKGVDRHDAADIVGPMTNEAVLAVYAKYRG